MMCQKLGLIEPLPAIIISFCFLGVMLLKRANLAITLNGTALLLALLALDWTQIPMVIYKTTDLQMDEGRLGASIVLATFGVMLLSQLYKETGLINRLSQSLSKLIKNPKIIMCTLPAVIGLLPVAGGALMSAPLVDSEAEKLGMSAEKKAYVNLWFRHTVFPVYPLSQVLIITAALTSTTVPEIISRQIPVVIVMIIVGYFLGFWKTRKFQTEKIEEPKNNMGSNIGQLLIVFLPILATIVVAVSLGVAGSDLSKQGFDVLIATLVGIVVLILVSRMHLKTFAKPFKSWGIYSVTMAAYGAFFLRNVMNTAGVSQMFQAYATNGNVNTLLLLTLVPAVLGFLMGSPSGGVAISASVMAGLVSFSPATSSLLYMSAYLGYTVAPTHLCFTFTADYFKCPISKVYKYVIPSFLITFAATLLVYFLF